MAETYDVTIPVLTAVSKLGIFWRQNSGMFRTLDGLRVIRATSIEGIADIMGCYKSHAVAIETKSGVARLEKSQKRFRRQWEANGGAYIIARNVDQALAGLRLIAELGDS